MKSEIEEVARVLSAELGIEVIYWDKTKESDFKGITDDRFEYGYIALRNDTGKEYSFRPALDFGCDAQFVTTLYKLVLDLECLSSEVALHLLIDKMLGCDLIIDSASVNADNIYKSETGKDIQQCGKKLICVDFSHRSLLGSCLTKEIKEC